MALFGLLSGKNTEADMTTGSTVRHLVSFAVPLLVGNIFQQLYNTVDTWVVGNYASNQAFSAVGSVTPIINLLIGFFMGLSSGAGVVISQYYGAKRNEKVSQAVHTSVAVTLLMGVVFTFLGIAMIPFMLKLNKTPDSVLPQSTTYLTIYFAGVIGLMVYNMGAGILRAVGDSTRPFYFLVVSAVINIVLDLVFVIVFEMGVAGVAYATIIAQGVSAVLVVITLMRTSGVVNLELKKLRIHTDVMKKILAVGLPAGLQMAITAFSNVFVQSYVNAFGENYMSGWTAYHKIDQFLFLPMQSLSLASTTFVGQNLGVNKVERARKGADTALGIAAVFTAVMIVPIVIYAPWFVRFFNSRQEVVEIGALLLRYITPFYILCSVNQIYSGALRGAGNSRVPMVTMLLSFVVFRQVYLFAVSRITDSFVAIAMGYPAGWLLNSLLVFICYKKADFSKTRLIEDGK
ncbi:MAG: MATE family efflux transporter [Clostridia bacterium]|nr:MATE family efflux transporter [Clostridia bacterium]